MSKYKAIISDIDGTLTPIIPNILPSERNSCAIKNAIEHGLQFSVASGRPFSLIKYLTDHLSITSPTISDNGAVIIDTPSEKPLWEAVLPNFEVEKILKIIDTQFYVRVSTDTIGLENPRRIPAERKVRKISIHDVKIKNADDLISKIEEKFKNITVARAASYKGESYNDVYISHIEGTKQHAVLKYAQLQGIATHEIIGIGDGYNDFPLLMACGFKVAMGNAVPELKEIADFIAPSVEADGVAVVIEKFL